ncbi:MMPL family transporter [Jannaschia sp. R86511]|uniref:MMPL family transporter n=1 Tax=Jannaschia sp. R86511 TaxID=3093853 RepID=UPI0036D305D1
MSLRSRLALATTALLSLVLLASSVASYLALRSSLDDQTERLLQQAVQRIEAVPDDGYVTTTARELWQDAAPAGAYVAAHDTTGAVVSERVPVGARSAPAATSVDMLALTRPTVVLAPGGGTDYVLHTAHWVDPVTVQTADGAVDRDVAAVTVGVPRDARDQTLADQREELATIWFLAVAACLVAAEAVAGAALRPLRQIAAAARRFANGERGRLRPESAPRARTEVDEVAAALDEAFGSRWRAEDRMRDFVADASHELRTPLAAVHGWADLYAEQAAAGRATPDLAEEVVGHVRAESTRMQGLVEDLLRLARLESLGPESSEEVDVAGLVADLTAETAALHPGHELEPVPREGAAHAVTDAAALGRAVRNLLVNAVRHTPPGTVVATRVAPVVVDGVAWIRIEVADDGPGIAQEHLAAAHERFWRAAAGRDRGDGGGGGLGLAIVHGTAQALGGSLTLRATGTRGLTAVLDIPQRSVSNAAAGTQDIVGLGGASPDVLPGVHDTTPALASAVTRHPRPGGLSALGRVCACHPLAVIGLWVAVLVAVQIGAQLAGGTYDDEVDVPDGGASIGAKLLEDAGAGGDYSSSVVFHTDDGGVAEREGEIRDALVEVSTVPGITGVGDPFDPTSGTGAVSEDGTIAYASLSYAEQARTLSDETLAGVEDAFAGLGEVGVEVDFGPQLGTFVEADGHNRWAELVGLVVALVVLLVSFGSIVGALLPLGTAILAAAVGLGVLGLLTAVLAFASQSPVLATMIGLGVGIDYALFLVTRYRQDLMDGVAPVDAAARAVGASGHSVLVAAGTVAVALLGLYASGLTFIGQLGLAAVITVVTAALGAITLVPATLGLVGRGIDRWSLGAPKAEPRGSSTTWYRYSRWVSRNPWKVASAATAFLLLLAAPLLDIRLGHIYPNADPAGSTTRQAYDLLAEGFGPGVNGPLTVVVDVATVPAEDVPGVVSTIDEALAGVDGTASVTPVQPVSDTTLVATVVPGTGPEDESTTALFRLLSAEVLPDAVGGTGAQTYVSGEVAGFTEFTDLTTDRLAVVILIVVLAAFLLLTATFRSVVVAAKAAALNLISIGAAYGVLVAVFQWGWGASLIGVDQPVPIESYVPLLMFAVVFGLSMDYEVFLLSRIKEAWLRTGDNTTSVAEGLAATGRVITAAALIMISVFSAFVFEDDVVIKMLAVGLAVSVLIDATIVRILLVPATMTLLGSRNWWIPRWLDRLLPHVEPEPLPQVHPRTAGSSSDQA